MSRFVHEKPHRLPREAYRGFVAVAVTACVEARRTPFTRDEIVRTFVEKLEQAAVKHHCRVPIYCFMPDHLHLIVEGTTPTADVWKAVVGFKQRTGFWFSQACPEFEWQKDFHDHVIRTNEDIGAQVRYIASNPVRKGLVQNWFDYPYTGSIGVDLHAVLAGATTVQAQSSNRCSRRL